VPAPPYDTTVEQLCDWEHMCAALAEAEPWWEPGTRFGYHARTFGFLLGEIVRRATGRTLSWWLHELVTVPLGIGDEIHFGVPEELVDRVARQQPPLGPPPPAPEPGSPADRAFPPRIRPDAAYANRRDVLTSDIPSEGTMTARGAARLHAALLGHVAGVELVSPARRATVAAVQFEGQDEVMGFPSRWAFGFSPQRPGGVPSRPGSTFGMVGMNGSAAYADIDSGVAVAVMRSRFDTDPTVVGEVDRIAADVGTPWTSTTRPSTSGVTMPEPVTELYERPRVRCRASGWPLSRRGRSARRPGRGRGRPGHGRPGPAGR
jgi:CubicO group peptidase (beta-lactamase class C family)